MSTDKIARYIWIGRKDQHWYRDVEIIFRESFGDERIGLITKLFAATSIATSLKANITLMRRALYELDNDLPIGNYLPNIVTQLQLIRNGFDLSGRKINSFARGMSGDVNAVVVDRWLLRAFDMDRQYKRLTGPHSGRTMSGGATDAQYTLIENYVRQEARACGLQPREMSAMIWSGVRIDQSGDSNTRYDHILKMALNNMFTV